MYMKLVHERYPNDIIEVKSLHDMIDMLSKDNSHVPNYEYVFVDGDKHSKLLYDFIWIYKNRHNYNKVVNKYGKYYDWYDELLKSFKFEVEVYNNSKNLDIEYEFDTLDWVMDGLKFYKYKCIAECVDNQTKSMDNEYLSELNSDLFVDDSFLTITNVYDKVYTTYGIKPKYRLMLKGLIPHLVYKANPKSFNLVKHKYIVGSTDEFFVYSEKDKKHSEYYYYYPDQDKDQLVGVIYDTGYYRLFEFIDMSDIHGYFDVDLTDSNVYYMINQYTGDIVFLSRGYDTILDVNKRVYTPNQYYLG